MTTKEKVNDIWEVKTDEPIYILLLHSDTEYYDWFHLLIGWAQCACFDIVWTYSEAAITEHIRINNLQKYIAPENENI